MLLRKVKASWWIDNARLGWEGLTYSEAFTAEVAEYVKIKKASHDVDLMSNIVAELHSIGRSDAWLAKHLGMDIDEILRLKQITGLAAMYANKEFSRSWEPGEGGTEQ